MSDEEDDINAGDDPEGSADSPTDGTRNYEVGYGRPPKKNQFKLGNKAAAGKRGNALTASKPTI